MPLASPFPGDVAFAERDQAVAGVPLLTAEEERALGTASSARRRTQFALGRACARAALGVLGVAEPFTIGRGEGREPLWPQGYVGSIAHSQDRAAAAAAQGTHYRGLGIDLEKVRLPSDALLRRVCRPREAERLAPLGDAFRAIGFTALFAAKESIYKAVNPLTGVYLGFQDAEVAFSPDTDWAAGGGGDLEWQLLKDSGPAFPPGARGQGAWRQQGEWMLVGVWIAAE